MIGTGNDSLSTTASDEPDKEDINKRGQSSPSRSSATSSNRRRNKSKGGGGKGAWKRKGAGGGLVDLRPDAGVTEQALTDVVSPSSGNGQSWEGGKDGREERMEECSFWVACGADGKVGPRVFCFL